VAGSVALAHWVDTDPAGRDHGHGRTGKARPAGRIVVFSVVRGAFEVRLVRIERVDPAAVRLRIGGWPVTGERLISHLSALTPPAAASGVATYGGGGPLGTPVRVPWLDHPAMPDTWFITLVGLYSPDVTPRCHAAVRAVGGDWDIAIRWPDGVSTSTRLKE
jgi:hypothetical protein